MTKIHHYDNALSFAQHNNTFSKSLEFVSHCEKQTAFTRHRKPFNGKAKHEKALKNDI